MASPYGGLGHGRANYSSAQIMHELQNSGYGFTAPQQYAPAQLDYAGAGRAWQQESSPASWTKPGAGFMASAEASTALPDSQHPTGAAFGAAPPAQAQAPARAQVADPYADYDPSVFAGLPPQLLEGATKIAMREPRLVSERILETHRPSVVPPPDLDKVAPGNVVVTAVHPVYVTEEVIEVQYVITKEYAEQEMMMMRMAEDAKKRAVPPKQAPEVVFEKRVVHVPKKEVQERLITVPKVRYVERIEYEDIIEYREVPVDRIVEVPEIEYRIREVEQLVPQTYIQEHYEDRYREVPVTQVQEVERVEQVPPAYNVQRTAHYPPSLTPAGSGAFVGGTGPGAYGTALGAGAVPLGMSAGALAASQPAWR